MTMFTWYKLKMSTSEVYFLPVEYKNKSETIVTGIAITDTGMLIQYNTRVVDCTDEKSPSDEFYGNVRGLIHNIFSGKFWPMLR